MKPLLALLIFVLTPLASAAENYCNGKPKVDSWGYHYPNGKPVKDSWGTYFPNGQKVFDSWGVYYPNGEKVRDSWGTYYPNKQKIYDSWGCYSPAGEKLECHGSFRVRAAVPGYGRVLLQVFPGEKRLGAVTFLSTGEGGETLIDIDYETREVVAVDLLCE